MTVFTALRRWGLLALAGGLAASSAALAQTPNRPAALGAHWQEAAAARAVARATPWTAHLAACRALALDVAVLRQELAPAPLEGTAAARGTGAPVVALPMPDGSTQRFRLTESPVMEPGLAAQFPSFKTYSGVGLDDPTATVRCDVTSLGFHAQVLSGAHGTAYIDPVGPTDPAHYVAYYRRDIDRRAVPFGCEVSGTNPTPGPLANRVAVSAGATLRTLRLAVAATGEYTAFHGGTVAGGQAAIVTTINRVNGVYEKELALRMVLVANSSSLVYTNASTDPYTNNDASQLLTQNQTNIDNVIGSANYDLGHVFSTGGGGLAGLGVVCTVGQKARGETGSGAPVGDAFDIDYVAHELGHQLGANHTFNSLAGSCSGNRNASTAIEPGSGTTIMAYAGICGSDNVQSNSDAYFCYSSYEEIQAELTSVSCYTTTATGNTAPTVSVPANRTIPANTPFSLTATGADANGDALTYCWENVDVGASVTLTAAQAANDAYPLFRSFTPTTSPTRYFPALANILANTTNTANKLPTVARSLRFRCTVRDQHAGAAGTIGGISNSGLVTLTVANTGAAFAVTAPNTNVALSGSTTVTWNVAGTTANGINCATVNILLSTDGGNTWPTTLASGVTNSGSASVTLPNLTTSTARVMVAAADNYFFDVSNANFSISPASANLPTISSFSPTSGAVGTAVTLTGTNFTGATDVSFGSATASSFTVNSPTSISTTVPPFAATGTISVTTAQGTGTSSASFTVLAAPTVTGFSPTSGAAGATISISGTGFTGTTNVQFNGTNAPFTVNSATSISATVLAGATTGPISVTNAQGTGTSGTSFTVVAAPANDLCTAPNLPVLQCGIPLAGTTVNATTTGDPTATCGTSITTGGVFYRFTGTGGPVNISTCGAATTYDSKLYVFSGNCGSLVCVGGNDDNSACTAQNTSSLVTFNSQAGTQYTVMVAGYNANQGPFTIQATCGTAAPTITTFSPTAGAPGTSVSLTGTNLNNTTTIFFNGTQVPTFTVNSSTSVTVAVPAGASTGPIRLMTGAGGTTGQVVTATSFTVLNPPTIANQVFSVAENSASGTVAGTVAASDPDAGQTLTYAITGGNTGGAFAINSATGQLTVAGALDFEGTATYALTVQATDNGSPTSAASATVTVNLSNVNEAPSVANQSFTIAENSAVATVAGTVAASDPDAGTTLTYAITGGNPGGVFAFSGNQLTVNAAVLDFEAAPSYSLGVQVSDGSLTAAATLTVGVGNVAETPTISGFTPASGPVGTVVTLTGTNFQGAGAASVAFNGTPATTLSVASATSLTATVPTGATTGLISVTNADGTATSATTFTVSVAGGPAPTVTSFSPTAAPIGGAVTITGTNFTGATAVTFNGTAATFTVNSATSISTTVPVGATTGRIRVTNAGGTAQSSLNFKVQPVITNLTPTSGTPGNTVTITGTGFTGATRVRFGSLQTTYTVVSSTTITATVPTGVITSFIYVTTPGGQATSPSTFVPGPILTSFLPSQGAPGSVILIEGQNVSSTTTVAVNGVGATTTFVSATLLTAVVPAGATTGALTVSNSFGSSASATSYTVVSGPIPTISSFTPTSGVVEGSVVTISGTNFTGATLVRFNNVNAASFTVNSATSISATVPAGLISGGRVYVVTPNGLAQSAGTLTGTPPPTISSLNPTSGSPGAVVLINGTGLSAVSSVRFNGVEAAGFTASSTQITATVPAGATTGKVSVTNIAGTAQSAATFTVTTAPAPTITSLSANQGPRGGTITINGTDFTGVTAVRLGSQTLAAGAYTVNSATQITATVPSSAITGRWYVVAAGGMAQSGTFTIILPPTLTSISPTSGPVGTSVTIRGAGYSFATGVTFGGVPATSFTILSPIVITAIVPAGAVTGPVAVTNPAGTVSSATPFTVTGPRAAAAPPATAVRLPLEAYPNPARDVVRLTGTRGAAVRLLDVMGRTVRAAALPLDGTPLLLDVRGLPPGLYSVLADGERRRLVIE